MDVHLPGTRSLRTLEAACRHLNFSHAAAEIGLTPAAVSHQVKEFEDHLGVRLFHRTNRMATLTPAGKIMHAAFREALDALMLGRTNARRTLQARRLQISAVDTVATKWLLPRIGKFTRLHPDIDVGVEVTTAIRDVRRDAIDVAFRWSRDADSGTRVERIFEHSIFPVCSPRLIEEAGMPKQPADLLDHKLIHVSWNEKGIVWPDWREWFEAARVDPGAARPGMHFTETGHAVQAAVDGHGIALGDACMVAGDLEAGRLVRLFDLAIGGPPGFSFCMATLAETADTEMIRTFREWVLAEADETMAVINAMSRRRK
ncbi:MAG: hypothetical protein ABS35_31660 [Kaistia sp. SCN 65-12]|nr:MAG: hypothetical protein ABS35_31660 [Kaistia sp. SCN 65-12]